MTHRSLIKEMLKIALILAMAFLWSLTEFYFSKNCQLKSIFLECDWGKIVSPTFVAQNGSLIAIIAGAYAAFVLQQRGKFIDDLRRWWNQMVNAKAEFYKYCDMIEPAEKDYLAGFYQLSASMDSLRLIYSNVKRSTKNPKGYYPYEQIRDIIDLAKSTEFKINQNSSSYKERQSVKASIDVIFQSLRHAIQDEARATVPDKPTLHDSHYRFTYINDLRSRFGVDLLKIRERNKQSN